jgi:hypothetical protein
MMKEIQIIKILFVLAFLIETLNGQYFSSWEDSTVSRIGKRINDRPDFSYGYLRNNKYKNILLASHSNRFKIPAYHDETNRENYLDKRLRYIIAGLSQLDKTKKID